MTQDGKVKMMPRDPEARLRHLARVAAQSLTLAGIPTSPEDALQGLKVAATRRRAAEQGLVEADTSLTEERDRIP